MRDWRSGARWYAAGLGAWTATLVLVLWGALPAAAGGRASVLLVSPGSEETAAPPGVPVAGAAGPAPGRDVPDLALLVSPTGRTSTVRSGEPRFAALWQLLQPAYTGTERVPGAWAEGGYPKVRITVVWGLTGVGGWPQTRRPPGGDVAVHRQDQLFVAEDGTPWVRSDPSPEVEDDDIRWHRAPRPVFARLDREGLLGEPEDRAAAGDVPVGGSPAGGSAEGGAGPGAAGVRWAAAGLAAGAGGMLLICRAAARRKAGPPREEPRQELVDL
ncbi:hypothetical protein [Streptomyces sp. NPDC006134]|uniref:hypothetical protein n=1 Tax=Streptomyces sp. NPDC006134 TaxID=3154467 RepID=UPI0033D4C3DE